jgi:hypothetical protein
MKLNTWRMNWGSSYTKKERNERKKLIKQKLEWKLRFCSIYHRKLTRVKNSSMLRNSLPEERSLRKISIRQKANRTQTHTHTHTRTHTHARTHRRARVQRFLEELNFLALLNVPIFYKIATNMKFLLNFCTRNFI